MAIEPLYVVQEATWLASAALVTVRVALLLHCAGDGHDVSCDAMML